MEKIQAHKIYLHRVEGTVSELQTVILSREKRPDVWGAATQMLRQWARTAPDGEGAHRVDFGVVFEDGTRYESEKMLTRCDAEDADMSQEVLQSLCLYAGRWKPPYFTHELYMAFLGSQQERHDAARAWLDRYDFGAEFVPPVDLPGLPDADEGGPELPDEPPVMIDVSASASVAGLSGPVEMTPAAWGLVARVPLGCREDVSDRLLLVLGVARTAAGRAAGGVATAASFQVVMAIMGGDGTAPRRVGFGVAAVDDGHAGRLRIMTQDEIMTQDGVG